ncbi:PKD domain-containing protein [Goodfellowiella coeruleoviolacea]|uniref:Glucose/arabinose dehydrogenase, beta-propeller fold n=1 Tax=Goodfellowiella coeruleoviolacea TaxID=334858 RepID=A0AAE3KE39_9PSEU|nr:PKD domain-containing protein [Goodfellowiella coeruleoviolacea]MCP2163507.1 Glucose/arabinose dehydrogenase, beta-propeller fold [Goodfellowiella coeruleoviolacea]
MSLLRRPLSALGLALAVALSSTVAPSTPAATAQPRQPEPPPPASVTVETGNTTYDVPGPDMFEKKKLTADVGEPMDMAVTPDGRVLMTDRRGVIRVFDPRTHNVTEAGRVEVYTGEEDGLQGIAIDPDFASNNRIYVYYAPAAPEPKNVLSRLTLTGNTIDPASEQVILEVPTQRDLCCHVGGDIDFDSKGNLLLSTGDNTNSWASDGYTPIDERPGRAPFDAQKSSANTNDLRGKLIRITVRDDGSYTIPEGNLFPPGTAGTRPEIYYMGLRNPFRFTVDKKTDWVWMGVVGPDASEDNPDRGPRQYEELLLITKPGNSGWPYCIGDNIPYNDFDFATNTPGPKFDCANLVNDSPNNTGLTNLPPADLPLIWYPYDCFDTFPQIDCPGGGTAMGGPVYRYDPDLVSDTKFPPEFDGAQFFYEYSRGFVKDVRVDEQGKLTSISPFLPELDFDQPMDLEFGPEGSLYVLEYGGGFFTPGPRAGLYRVDYTRGQHSPTAHVTASATAGSAPLTVRFDASGSSDADGDALSFAWDFDGDGTNDASGARAEHTYTATGQFSARLTVTDSTGKITVARVRITVGNHAPSVTLDIPGDGGLFSFGDKVSYRVSVTDAEDGGIGSGVDCDDVTVQVALGHDEHAHPQTSVRGCEGVIQTSVDSGHGGAANLFTVVRATYTDRGGQGVPSVEGSHEIVLQPRHKQAEHFTQAQGARVVDDQAAEGTRAVSDVDGSGWIAFDPVDLAHVDAVGLRVAAATAGTVEFHSQAPDGPLVSTVHVPAGAAGEYRDVEPAPVSDPGGSHPLYAVLHGSLRVDAVHFTGLGAAGPRNVHALADIRRGPAPMRVAFTGSAADAPEGATFDWDFGDGTSATGATVSHSYAQPGEYTATVTLRDAQGRSRGSAATQVRAFAPVAGTLTVRPESAGRNVREQHQVTATVAPAAAGQQVSVEVYRASPASPLPPGSPQGTPYLRAERQVVPTDQAGTAVLAYTSAVAADDIVVACLAFGDSCVRGDGPLVVAGQELVNLRADVPVGTATTTWRPAPDADGWLTLFDGRSLAGWQHVGTGSFTVDDGLLQPSGSGRGVLWYDKQRFTDYVFEAEYESFSVSANSGLYLRFGDPGGNVDVPGRDGYEVAILDRVDNAINRTGSISGVKAADFLAAKPPYGGWNTLSVQVSGRDYTVTLNGQVVTRYTSDGARGNGDRIGIENAGDQLRFRNVRIRPSADTTAPTARAVLDPPEPNGDPVSGFRDTYHSPVSVTLSADDGTGWGVAGVEYQVDGGEWTEYRQPVLVSAAGRHTLAYRATDAAGNTSPVAQVAFTIKPDACVGSDLRSTVVLGDVDSRVANAHRADGCTVEDLIRDEQAWPSRVAFVRHVDEVTARLVRERVLSARDRGALLVAALRSGIGGTG